MNQKLSDWASIAEIASGIAVVVTLVVLIAGINENADMTRALVFDRNIDGINEVRSYLVQDRELAELMIVYFDGTGFQDLARADQARVRFYLQMVFGAYEKAYFASQYGVMGEAEWARFEAAVCRQLVRLDEQPDIRRNIVTTVTAEFIEQMDRACKAGEYTNRD
jgi:hypothetical protein